MLMSDENHLGRIQARILYVVVLTCAGYRIGTRIPLLVP